MTTGSAFMVASVGVVGGLILLSRFSWPRRTTAARPLDDSGSAAMEMVIVLPLFLTTIMVVVQCTHLMFATVLLEHAAFCVSRSASVQLFKAESGEGANQLGPVKNSVKLNRLNAVANLLMAPMNRRYAGPGSALLPGFNVSLPDYLRGSFVPDPEGLYGGLTVVSDLTLRWGAGIVAQAPFPAGDLAKWGLNLGVTRVEIRTTDEPLTEKYDEDTQRSFGESSILVVTVINEYPLDVPAGGNLLGPLIGHLPSQIPDFLTEAFARLTGTRYRVDITSTYSVVNWGQTEAKATP